MADRMATAIGAVSAAEFHRSGRLELDLLIQVGFTSNTDLVDVGCGSGRLAAHLDPEYTGRYLGTDLSADLTDYARANFGGSNRSFQVVNDLTIPAADNSFDMACFFSVLTHLRHEESFLYLCEARRVLRPGGRIVATFLEYSQRNHWAVFDSMVERRATGVVAQVDQFICVDGLHAWAELGSLVVDEVHHGATPHIQTIAGTLETLGQSVVVFSLAAS